MATKSGEKLFYEDLTYQIRGACFDVWKQFGGSFKESIIDKALSVDLGRRNLKVENQKRIDIYYKDQKVGTYVPDKIVNNKVLIELKSKPYISKEDEKQFWKYLKGSTYKVGMLINFGPEKLEIKRRIYDRAREKEFFRVDPRNNQRCSASTENGITLIEIIIVIFLISIFSLILIADFPKISRQMALSRATYKLAQDLRKTEDFGLSGVPITGVTAKGYGVYVSSAPETQYIIYADSYLPADNKYTSGDYIIETVDVTKENSSLSIEKITNANENNPYTSASINFSPPNPTITITTEPNMPVTSTIKIWLRNTDGSSRKVLINSSGLIEVQ